MSSRMNTIASCDQFKPIRIGENLVVNLAFSMLRFLAFSKSLCGGFR